MMRSFTNISRETLWAIMTALLALGISTAAMAAGIKVVPSASKVTPGEVFYADVVVENIPPQGLGAVQFRLNVEAPGSTVTGVADASQGAVADIAVSAPLVRGPAAAGRSGLGDFFWNGRSPHGILVMDNEAMSNGSGLYAFGHTNGAAPPAGSGTVARIYLGVGNDVTAEKITISLTDVALLDAGTVYPLESNIGAIVDLKCYTTMPALTGMSRQEAEAALAASKLLLGTVSELDNHGGAYSLDMVLVQPVNSGSTILCETEIDLAINTAPADVQNAQAVDKAGDETGTVILTWTPSASADVAGYRIYNTSGVRLAEFSGASATGADIAGLAIGQTAQLRVTAFDTHGNESPGVVVAATATDDMAPRIAISAVSDGACYAAPVQPAVSVEDANLATSEITLNGAAYALTPVDLDGLYILTVSATDLSGNRTAREVSFTVDRTQPVITVTGVEKGKYYNTDLIPVITVTDANLDTVERSLNNQDYIPGTPITAENSYELGVSARDKAGNSAADAWPFFIDKMKPVSSLAVGTPQYESAGTLYVGGTTAFTLAGADAGAVVSGISSLEYRTNDGAWNAYQAPFSLSSLSDGAVTVNYRAADNATNIEDFKTLTLTLDATAPVTVLTAAAPQHVDSAGTTFVTRNTIFTLSAADASSGVASTEYRIDDGLWTAYAPFFIVTEGEHTIRFRSTDNVTNSESEKVLNVIVDNTPPASTITVGAPQYVSDGNLFISGGTMISLAALDALSGVEKTEYSIDGGGWTAYSGGFTIAALADGEHRIRYRSTDNVGNEEGAKELAVVLDKTPPATSITASDPLLDGIVNAVSPKTVFTLAATDNVAGVKTISFKIDDGAWQTYCEGFALAALAAGEHTIAYKAVDNVLNEETTKTVTVRLIVIEVEKKLAADSVVLVGVWSDKSDKVQKDLDIQRLDDILASLKITYTIARNMDEFTTALRSGRYTTYFLIDVKEPVVGEEIREAVRFGDGLIFIKTQPASDPFLDDVFGLTFTGKSAGSDLMVDLVESPIGNEGTIQSSGKNVISSVSNGTTQTFGMVTDKQAVYPAIVFNQYGRGRSILYAFDLLAGPDQAQAAALLINSLNYVRPLEHYVRAQDSAPVRIRLSNSSEQIDVRVTETVPEGATADTITPQAAYKDGIITWQKTFVADEQAAFHYYLNLPDLVGDYISDAGIHYRNGGEYRLYGNYGLKLTIDESAKEILQSIIADLSVMTTANVDDENKLEDAVNLLYQVSYEAGNRKQAEKNIKSILNAVDKVRSLSNDTAALRLRIDELLKIWEKKWWLLEK